jgi:hypothetical protein
MAKGNTIIVVPFLCVFIKFDNFNNDMLKRISGTPNMIMVPKKASTAFPSGSAITFDAATGFIKPLTATDPSVFGVIQSTVTSTDADYASNTSVLVDQGDLDTVWEVDVSNGGAATPFAATDVGQFFKMGGTASGIDCNTRSSTAGSGFTAQGLVFLCVGFISATTAVSAASTYTGKGLFKIMSMSQARPSTT